jgi:hypothetical protein
MAKAALTLPNGTVVQIEGTVEEVQALLSHYGSAAVSTPTSASGEGAAARPKRRSKAASKAEPRVEGKSTGTTPNLAEIVNLAKTCDEAEAVETQILDRTSVVDRTLLPLYIVHEHLDNRFGLTSGEVSRITTDLGVPVSQPNASTALSGTASKYVIGDKVRKKGQPVRYKLSRRGLKYVKAVIGGKSDENTN